MTSYPALTIWQPWATLIAVGAKPYEFRSWAAPRAMQGRRIAIHAGARPTRKAEVRELLLQLHSLSWRQTGLIRDIAIATLEPILSAPGALPLRSVLCLATLGTPIRDTDLEGALGTGGLINDSDRDAHTNWGWPLTDIEVLRPFVPATGAQGFWTWHGGDEP
jgi:hypothetical protein